MTTINDTGVEALRARVGSTLAGRLGAHIERLDWDAGKLERFQRDELRRLLAHAVERSPFHARRLLGIDPERFELEQLALLPVMSKEQMMSSFDELLTDRRLTRARVEEHLAALGSRAQAARRRLPVSRLGRKLRVARRVRPEARGVARVRGLHRPARDGRE